MGKGKSKDSCNEVRTGWKKPTKVKAFFINVLLKS